MFGFYNIFTYFCDHYMSFRTLNMIFKHNILAFFLVIAATAATAKMRFDIKTFGMEHMLSSNYVLSIAGDKHGFIWFATEEGLNRFDGRGFTAYYKGTGHTPALTGNELNCILDDSKAPVLWIGTQRNGLNAYNYDTGQSASYLHEDDNPNSIITNEVTGLCHAFGGGLWVATFWNGVDRFDAASGHFEHYNMSNVKGLPDNQAWCVMDAGGGIVFVGHVSRGLSVMDTRRRTAHNFMHDPADPASIAGNEVHSLLRDSRGNIWVGTDHGLDLFVTATGKFIHITDGGRLVNRVYDIREMSDGTLWAAVEQTGIAILTYTQGLPASLGLHADYLRAGYEPGSLNTASLRCLYEDSFANVWIGTYGSGVNFLSRRSPLFMRIGYSPMQPVTGLTIKQAMGVCTDGKGNLWVGTDGDGINVFDRDMRRIREIRNGIGKAVQTAFRDSRGRLWFGCFMQGIYVYDGGAMRHITSGLGGNEDGRAFAEDRDGMIWTATRNGIYVIDPVSLSAVRHYDCANNLTRTIVHGANDCVWVGTFGTGLVVCSRGMRVLKHFDTKNGFPSNTINQIMKDSKGRLWVATGEGLVRFDSEDARSFRVYNRRNGLANVHIRSITEDLTGNIWVGTNTGISCLNCTSSVFDNYIYKDNVPVGNFYPGGVAAGTDGMLYFTSNGGLCCFNPREVLAHRTPPPPVITGMTVTNPGSGGKDSTVNIMTDKIIELDYSHNTFSLSFSVLNYAMTDHVEYSYMLEGLQREWVVSDGNAIKFNNLPPGKYRLTVRDRLRNGEWAKATASLDIVILPPWYLSWWMKTLYALVVVMIVWVLLRIYRTHLHMEYLYRSERREREHEQALNKERLSFYTDITHELRTPLTLIIGPLEDLAEDSGIPAVLKQKIGLIHKNAMRLYDLVSRILELRKADSNNRKLCVGKGNIVAVVRELCVKYSELEQRDEPKIRFEADEEIINVYFDKEIIGMTVDNLVSNAIKYTERGEIVIKVERCTDQGVKYVQLSVRDTGFGISEEALPHVFERYYQEKGPHQASGTGIGLALVKSLVELHQGTVTAESRLDEGSIFRVRILEDNTYDNSLRASDMTDEVGEKPQEKDSAGHERRLMLVVDDNRDICQYIADSFRADFDIMTADNGERGMEAAQSSIPDIIISDVMMTNMDGNEMCRRLKNDVRTSHIPIILLTAKDSMAAREEGYQSGADSYITKPFVRSLLASRVDNLLNQRRMLTFGTDGNKTTGAEDMNAKRKGLIEALGEIDREFMAKVDGLIKAKIESSTLDVDYLAENMNVSSSTLYRKMVALTGLSAKEYIRKYRLHQAEQLLLKGKYSIAEVGYMVGINTTAYFRKCFKEEFGVTPSEYIDGVKKNKTDSKR